MNNEYDMVDVESLDLEDLRDNFIDRFDDLEPYEPFWMVREELQEELCKRLNERAL